MFSKENVKAHTVRDKQESKLKHETNTNPWWLLSRLWLSDEDIQPWLSQLSDYRGPE